MTKEAYYFSHDSNARNDEKVLMLRADHGWQGYGIYWALIEMMFESSETALHHDKIKGIAVSYNIDITVLKNVINTCVTEGLFLSDGDMFWSESLKRRKGKYKEMKEKKAEAGRKGMAKRWAKDNSVKENDNTVITENNKGKESKGNESKGNESKENKIPFVEIVSYLNVKTSSSYKPASKKTKDMIEARWNEGFTLDDFKRVIDIKTSEWLHDPKMVKFLRPETLFSNKFEGYLNQKTVQAKGQWEQMTEKTAADEEIFGNPIDYEYDENDFEF